MAQAPKGRKSARGRPAGKAPFGGQRAYTGTIHQRPADRLEVPPSPAIDPLEGAINQNGIEGGLDIYNEAKMRFDQCQNWEKDARKLFLEDLKFANADSDNGFQWPNHMRRNRDVDTRPALTVNQTRQHCLQIINDAKKNPPSVKVSPCGGAATFRSAIVFGNVIRYIERKSHAQTAYNVATEFQVKAGIGYWRVTTRYVSDRPGPEAFSTEPAIEPIINPLGVYLDPDIQQRDGSDARFGFVFQDEEKEKFKKEHPKYAGSLGQTTFQNKGGDDWLDQWHVRVCEYFRKTEKRDTLVAIMRKEGEEPIVDFLSNIRKIMSEEQLSELLAKPETRQRDVITDNVEWYKIVGRDVVEKEEWDGKYIPLVRVIGEETIIDGKLDRKGHTRNLKDPQRIYNYWTSAAVEHLALQGKTPWIAPEQAIEGHETYWFTANRVNHAVLPYNQYDEDGNKLDAPQRPAPPEMSQGYLNGMKVAADEFMRASGQWQSEMGQPGNEKSGKAINERQRQGDTATYGFIDNLAIAIRYTGVILIDLIPRIFDTRRVIMIMGKDGKENQIQIDPAQTEPYKLVENQRDAEAIIGIFNPAVGQYSVEADIGPGYATMRQEAFDKYMDLFIARPEAFGILGDLWLRNADWEGADEAAERVMRSIPAHILGQGPSEAEQRLDIDNKKLTSMVTDLTQRLAEKELALSAREADREIDVYRALTDRMKALEDKMPNERMFVEAIIQALHTNQQAEIDLRNILAKTPSGAGEAGDPASLTQKPEETSGLLNATASGDPALGTDV